MSVYNWWKYHFNIHVSNIILSEVAPLKSISSHHHIQMLSHDRKIVDGNKHITYIVVPLNLILFSLEVCLFNLPN